MSDGARLGWSVDPSVYSAWKGEYDDDEHEQRFQLELAMRSWMTKLDRIETDYETPTDLREDLRQKKKTPSAEKVDVWRRVHPRTKERFQIYVDRVGLDNYGEGLELAMREHLTAPVFPALADPEGAEFDLVENRDEEISEAGDDLPSERESPIEALPEETDIWGKTVPVRENFERASEEHGSTVTESAARLVAHVIETESYWLSRNDLREMANDLDIGRGDGLPSKPTAKKYTDIVREALNLSPHPVYANPERYGAYGQRIAAGSPRLDSDPEEVSVWDRHLAPAEAITAFIDGFEEEQEDEPEQKTFSDSVESSALLSRPSSESTDESEQSDEHADEALDVLTDSASYENAAADD